MNCATAGTNHIPGCVSSPLTRSLLAPSSAPPCGSPHSCPLPRSYAGHLCDGDLAISGEKELHSRGPEAGDRPTLKPNLQND